MNYTAFFDSLKRGEYASLYLFTGEEQYVKRSALGALRKALLPEGLEPLNESVLDAAAPAQRIIEEAETLPMLCDRRLVVVNDWAPLAPGRARDEAAESERMAEWLSKAPDTCCVVFYLTAAPDGRKKLTRDMEKLVQTVEFPLLGEEDLFRWISRRLRDRGKRMERAVCELFVAQSGRALTGVQNELDKLCAYVGEREEITASDVALVVPPSTESTVFQMIDCLLAGQNGRAYSLLNGLLDAGESRVGIIAMLTRQVRLMTHQRSMSEAQLSSPQIEEALGLSRYQLRRYAAQAARFDTQALREAYRACVEADYAIKSGRMREEEALEMLMLTLNALLTGCTARNR